MSELSKLVELLRFAVEQGQTINLTADSVTVSVDHDGGVEVTINGPSIGTES
jgi:hypothetical protein